jgi:hypothetical protein
MMRCESDRIRPLRQDPGQVQFLKKSCGVPGTVSKIVCCRSKLTFQVNPNPFWQIFVESFQLSFVELDPYD